MIPNVSSIKFHLLFGKLILSEQYEYNNLKKRFVSCNTVQLKTLITICSVVLTYLTWRVSPKKFGIQTSLNISHMYGFLFALLSLMLINYHVKNYHCEFYNKIIELDDILVRLKLDGRKERYTLSLIHFMFVSVYIYGLLSGSWLGYCSVYNCGFKLFFIARQSVFAMFFYKLAVLITLWHLIRVRMKLVNDVLEDVNKVHTLFCTACIGQSLYECPPGLLCELHKIQLVRYLVDRLYSLMASVRSLMFPIMSVAILGLVMELYVQMINAFTLFLKLYDDIPENSTEVKIIDAMHTLVLHFVVIFVLFQSKMLTEESRRTPIILRRLSYGALSNKRLMNAIISFSSRVSLEFCPLHMISMRLDISSFLQVYNYIVEVAVIGLQFSLYKHYQIDVN